MYLSLGPYSSPSRSRVQLPNGAVLSAEVMDTPEKRAAGMQFRNGFPKNTVMLFVHPTPGNFRYHMRNVKIPLQFLFLDSTGRITSVRGGTPGQTSVIESPNSAAFAIEAPSGFVSANNLKIGDQIQWG
jgi:uncharacterized protein